MSSLPVRRNLVSPSFTTENTSNVGSTATTSSSPSSPASSGSKLRTSLLLLLLLTLSLSLLSFLSSSRTMPSLYFWGDSSSSASSSSASSMWTSEEFLRSISSSPSSSSSRKPPRRWAIATPDSATLYQFKFEWHEELLLDDWKILIVVDVITHEVSTRLFNSIDRLSLVHLRHLRSQVSLIDSLVDIPLPSPSSLNSPSSESSSSRKVGRSLRLQSDLTIRRRMFGTLYAISKGATSILHLGNGDVSFVSPPSLVTHQDAIDPISSFMFYSGKLFSDPYRAFHQTSSIPFDSVFDTLLRFSSLDIWEDSFDIGPQQLRVSLQQFLQPAKEGGTGPGVGVGVGEGGEIKRTVLVTPENSFSLLSDAPLAFHSDAFWVLPIAPTTSSSRFKPLPSLQKFWSFWVQRGLWEMGNRVGHTNKFDFEFMMDEEDAYHIRLEKDIFSKRLETER
jgi:hypothetical protein